MGSMLGSEMKEQKAPGSKLLKPDWTKLPRPEPTMNMDSTARKVHGRLTREVMGKLGKTLEAYFDDVRKEGVPDHIRQLVEQFDQRQQLKDKEPS
jgi:hypothetical protein